jgi:hypothetical protein
MMCYESKSWEQVEIALLVVVGFFHTIFPTGSKS